MNKRILLSAVVLLAGSALANGFKLSEASAQAAGMGGAVTGLVDDSTAIYWNPAGIAGREGLDVSAGISLVLPTITFKSDATGASTTTNPGLATPFNAFISYGITDKFSIGLGVFNPFGASITWPDGWEGAGRALSSSVQTFEFNPTVAYAPTSRIRLAAGLQVVRGTVFITRALDFGDSQGQVALGGDAWGFGWNLGVQADLVEHRLSLGASFRSGVGMNFAGRAHFSNIPVEYQSTLADQAISSSIILPNSAALGVGITPIDSLRIGVDVNLTVWQTFTDLTIAFTDPSLTNPLPKHWATTASVSAGAEYEFIKGLQGRLGFVWDPTGSPSLTLTPDLPDATRYKFTVGLGWRASFGLRIDAAYQYVLLAPATSTAPGFTGTYSGSASVISLNVGYRL